MQKIIGLLISFVIPLFVGKAIYQILLGSSENKGLLAMALSFGLGMGIVTHWMLLVAFTGHQLTLENILIPLLGLGMFLYLLHLQALKTQSTIEQEIYVKKQGRMSPVEHAVFTISIYYIIFQIVFVFWRALNIPFYSWDAIYVVAAKAKIFFYERNLSIIKNFNLSSYPLHVPLSLTWVAFNLHAFDEQLLKIIFPIYFVAYIMMHYCISRRYLNWSKSTIGVALLCSASFFTHHATIAYRDLPLMFYHMATAFLLFTWYRRNNTRYLILAGIFAGITLFVKLEAMGYFFIYLVLLVFCLSKMNMKKTKKLKLFIQFCFIAGVFAGIFFFYRQVHAIGIGEGRMKFDFSWQKLLLIPQIGKSFTETLFFTGNWNILWFIFIVSLIFNWRKITNNVFIQYLLIFLGCNLLLYFFVALLTNSFISIAGKYYPTVLSRIFLHFYPVCPLLIMLFNFSDAEENLS